MARPHTVMGRVCPNYRRFEDAAENTVEDEWMLVKVQPLRRLSLGDLPSATLGLDLDLDLDLGETWVM